MEYFEPYGEVVECDIVKNYAFVVSIYILLVSSPGFSSDQSQVHSFANEHTVAFGYLGYPYQLQAGLISYCASGYWSVCKLE